MTDATDKRTRAQSLADKWRVTARRDDVLDMMMVPSDVRELVGAIDHLIQAIREAVAEAVAEEEARAKFIEDG